MSRGEKDPMFAISDLSRKMNNWLYNIIFIDAVFSLPIMYSVIECELVY